jgi:hypothetical protein
MPLQLTSSALFVVPYRGVRKQLNEHRLESRRADIAVYFSGTQLDQYDCDLWLAIMRLARGKKIGSWVTHPGGPAGLLREIGKGTSGKDYKWLESSLKNMHKASIQVEVKKLDGSVEVVQFRIMSSAYRKDPNDNIAKLFHHLDPAGAVLFKDLAYVAWEERIALKDGLAKAVQIHAASQPLGKQYWVRLADLKAFVGYTGRLRDFEPRLRSALEELEANGILKDVQWKRDDGIVGWRRSHGTSEN